MKFYFEGNAVGKRKDDIMSCIVSCSLRENIQPETMVGTLVSWWWWWQPLVRKYIALPWFFLGYLHIYDLYEC